MDIIKKQLSEETAEEYMRTPYWGKIETDEEKEVPGEVDEWGDSKYFSTTPVYYEDYEDNQSWQMAYPAAYERFYELIYFLREINNMERNKQYIENDEQYFDALRKINLLKKPWERELRELTEYLAKVSHNILWWWVEGHLTHFHPMIGGGLIDEINDGSIDVEEQAKQLKIYIDALFKTIYDQTEYTPQDSYQYYKDIEEDEEGLEELIGIYQKIVNSDHYRLANYRRLMREHEAFPVVVEALKLFHSAKNWEDLIIPIDIAKNISHTCDKTPNLFEAYGGFAGGAKKYQDLFNQISSGAKENVWKNKLRMAEILDKNEMFKAADIIEGQIRIESKL